MNRLVAYGGSDEETSPMYEEGRNPLAPGLRVHSPSPPAESRDGEEEEEVYGRQRKDSDYFNEPPYDDEQDRDSDTADGFAEPPPPKRVETEAEHSPSLPPLSPYRGGMSKNASTASLINYEKDAFEKEDERLARGNKRNEPGSSDSYEPAPPMRQPTVEEEDEDAIDRQLAECKDLMKVTGESGGSETGASTPRYDISPSVRQEEGPATPAQLTQEDEVQIPAAPNVPCDANVAEKFRLMFEKKAHGFNVNKMLEKNKEYHNPSIYELFIQRYEIKELGSNFPTHLYDPDGFPEDSYFDKIAEQQKILMDKAEKRTHTVASEPASKRLKY